MEILIMHTNQLTLSLRTHGDTKAEPGNTRSRYWGYKIKVLGIHNQVSTIASSNGTIHCIFTWKLLLI
uniref:Uncharacterized protein n=1 Tax=Picea glauca TaxID=3330 RepID=A0A101LXS8_PICGL|nr:hypothetical protein ABT39_MTgene5511 [Picea glauca]